MHLGGVPVMIAGGVIALTLLIRSNIRFKNKSKETTDDTLFQTILSTENPADVWPLLRIYINEKEKMFLSYAAGVYDDVATGFMKEDTKMLSRAEKSLLTEKNVLKSQRRKLTLCLRQASPETAMEKSTWFHLSNNMATSMTYCLIRINEICKEHVDNNFRPLPRELSATLENLKERIVSVLHDSEAAVEENSPDTIDMLRRRCDGIKAELSRRSHEVYDRISSGDASNLTVTYVYLNFLQESQELVTSLRKMLRAAGKLNLAPRVYRSFSATSSEKAS